MERQTALAKKERREIRVGESLRIGMLSSPSTSGKTYEDPCPIQTRRDKRINLLQVGLVYDAELAKDSSPSRQGLTSCHQRMPRDKEDEKTLETR